MKKIMEIIAVAVTVNIIMTLRKEKKGGEKLALQQLSKCDNNKKNDNPQGKNKMNCFYYEGFKVTLREPSIRPNFSKPNYKDSNSPCG